MDASLYNFVPVKMEVIMKDKTSSYNRTRPYPSRYLGASLIGGEEIRELLDVVREKSPFRHYGEGNPGKVEKFELEAAKFLNSRYTLGVSSGTGALFCALAALSVGVGDEVILSSFNWYSDFNCIVAMGALPVFADIDESLNMDPADFERKITPRTKAVIVTHYQGGPADMDRIMAIAKKHGIKVIEDNAQAFGGEYKGKKLGTIGDIGIASFQTNKMLTCGEGGLLYTDNEEYFIRAVRYHDLGTARDVFINRIQNKELANEDFEFAGCQFRMSELAGAFMLAQLRKLPTILERCRAGHRRIREAFKDSSLFSFRPVDEGDCGITVFMLFETPELAARFHSELANRKIPVGTTSACCSLPDTKRIKNKGMVNKNNPPFGPGFAGEYMVYDSAAVCPNTSKIRERYISFGIGPLYTDEDINDIICAIGEAEKAVTGK